MNNQVILSALESQLATKKSELDSYETSTSEPAFKTTTQEVLESLRENVSNLIPSIILDTNRIEIMKSAKLSSGWSAITVYLENDWRSEDKTKLAKMNWYGSSATTKEENILNDVQIFGAVASKLSWIEYEFLNNWRPRLLEISKPLDDMRSEIYKIESSIRDVQNKVKQEGISTYKQEGFACALTPSLNIFRNWEEEGNPYQLQSSTPNIELSTGRGKWDYVYAKSFKILKTNKYKTTLEVTQTNDTVIERTVTARSFDQFISKVYDWQTSSAKNHNDKTTEKFNSQYAKQSA